MSNRIFFGYPDGRLRHVPIFMGGADDWIGLAEPTTINKRVDAETVVFGTTTLYRERMQIAGASSAAIAPVSATSGLLVEFANTTITASLAVGSSLVASLTAGTTLTASLTAGSTLTASLTAGSTVGVILTTASKVQIETSAAGTIPISGNSTVSLAAGSTLTASLTAGSTLTASLTAGSTMTVSLTAASSIAVTQTAATTFVVTGTSNVSGSTVIAYTQTNQLWQGTTSLTPLFASISFATSGAQTIATSVASASIRVLQWNVVCASTTSLQWRSGTSALTGLMPFAANGGISVPFSPVGLFQATSGSSLVLFNEAASSVGGSIVYLRSTSL